MKKIFITSFLSLLSIGLFSQDKYLKNITDTQSLSESIVSLFQENKISIAFNKIGKYWPIPQNELESFEEKTIKYLNILDERFGQSIGTIKIKNDTISDFAIRETYLIRYENTAIRLIFTYYKNNNGWIVNAFMWDDSFSNEFK